METAICIENVVYAILGGWNRGVELFSGRSWSAPFPQLGPAACARQGPIRTTATRAQGGKVYSQMGGCENYGPFFGSLL